MVLRWCWTGSTKVYQLGVFLFLLALGYGWGQYLERRHYRSIIKREAAFRRIPVFATRHLPADLQAGTRTELVMGSVVISKNLCFATFPGSFSGLPTPHRRYEGHLIAFSQWLVWTGIAQVNGQEHTAALQVKLGEAGLQSALQIGHRRSIRQLQLQLRSPHQLPHQGEQFDLDLHVVSRLHSPERPPRFSSNRMLPISMVFSTALVIS